MRKFFKELKHLNKNLRQLNKNLEHINGTSITKDTINNNGKIDISKMPIKELFKKEKNE